MDILKIIDNLRDNLWAKYGNPLASYKKTQTDIHNTYYVGKLMEVLGHKHISPSRIQGEKEDRIYYSEPALHDAFLAGRLLSLRSNDELRKEIREEIKSELMDKLDRL